MKNISPFPSTRSSFWPCTTGLAFFAALSSLASTPALGQSTSSFPAGYCAKQCDGTKPKGAKFDFANAALAKGGFNPGQPSGSATAPTDSSGSGSEPIHAGQFLGQIGSTEEWVNGQCGTSLSDDTVDSYVLLQPCDTPLLYRKSLGSVSSAHIPPNGLTPPATLPIMDAFFQAAKSPENKAALASKKFQFRSPIIKPCAKKGWEIGSTNTLFVGLGVESCKELFVPAAPGQIYTGMPAGSRTKSRTDAGLKSAMLGLEFIPFQVKTVLDSPAQGKVSTQAFIRINNADIYTVPAATALANEANINETRKNDAYSWDKTIPFTVGPIPMSISFGTRGSVGATVNIRNTNMWSNGRGVPTAKLDGYANAAVDLWIAKAGIEAYINFVTLFLDNYAFSGALYTNTAAHRGFIYSSQISSQDGVSALAGNLSAFAKVRVPKFFGWKWKRWGVTLLDFPSAVTSNGWLYNEGESSLPFGWEKTGT
jgi:hypothetical protein